MEQSKKFGSDYSFQAADLNADQIRKINDGRLADREVVCTANDSAIQNSFKYVDKKGAILFFAVPSKDINIPSVALWRNEISIYFHHLNVQHKILYVSNPVRPNPIRPNPIRPNPANMQIFSRMLQNISKLLRKTFKNDSFPLESLPAYFY